MASCEEVERLADEMRKQMSIAPSSLSSLLSMRKSSEYCMCFSWCFGVHASGLPHKFNLSAKRLTLFRCIQSGWNVPQIASLTLHSYMLRACSVRALTAAHQISCWQMKLITGWFPIWNSKKTLRSEMRQKRCLAIKEKHNRCLPPTVPWLLGTFSYLSQCSLRVMQGSFSGNELAHLHLHAASNSAHAQREVTFVGGCKTWCMSWM